MDSKSRAVKSKQSNHAAVWNVSFTYNGVQLTTFDCTLSKINSGKGPYTVLRNIFEKTRVDSRFPDMVCGWRAKQWMIQHKQYP